MKLLKAAIHDSLVFDEDKLEFARSWHINRDWEFSKKERKITRYLDSCTIKTGTARINLRKTPEFEPEVKQTQCKPKKTNRPEKSGKITRF